MVRSYKKKGKPYNDGTLAEALKEIDGGASIKETGRKYLIWYGKLHADYQRYKEESGNDAAAKKKPKKKVTQPKKQPTAKKIPVVEEDADSDSTTVSSIEMTDANTSSDLSLTDIIQDDMEATEGRATDDSHPLCTIEDSDVGKHVAVYYTDRTSHYYWGKVTKVFSRDEDTDVTEVEVDFLQKKTISSDPSAWTWTEKKVKEVLVVETKFIIYGPVTPDIRKNIFTFPVVQGTASLQKLEGRHD